MWIKNIILCVLIFTATLSVQENISAQIAVGTQAPEWRLEGLDGKWVSLSAFKNKVTLLYFLGAGCQFCQLTAPYIQSIIWQAYGDSSDVQVIGIDSWDGTKTQIENNFISYAKVTFPIFLNGSKVALEYKLGYDWFVVLDRDHTVAYVRSGTLFNKSLREEDVAREVKAEIDKLLVVTGISDEPAKGIPEEFELGQNYPNPFNPVTHISFSLPWPSSTVLEIYNIGGGLVTAFRNHNLSAGAHRISWDGRDAFGNPVSSGVYIYRLTVGGAEGSFRTAAKKMMLLK